MLRMKFWTSEIDVKKCSKRPWDPHNRIRLEKLCPKVLSDRQIAGRMTSKRRFWTSCPIIENQALNDLIPAKLDRRSPWGRVLDLSRGLIGTIHPPILAEHMAG